jgi:polyribonucleotide nucleotidyltransferase
MDIKIEGLSMTILRNALNQAHDGRIHILGKMNEALDAPREELSKYAPRFSTIQIPQDRIGAVIGTGGETIRSIVAESGAEVNIEEDGTVLISSVSGEASERAIAMIKAILRKPEEGETYLGKVKEIREGLGALIEFIPKQVGLLHISQIAYDKTENVSDVLEVGQEIEIKLLEISRDGKYRLSRKALLPKPEGYVEQERPPRSGGYRDGGRDRRDSRDSRGGDRRSSGNRRDSGERRDGDRRDGDRRDGDRRDGDRRDGDRRDGDRRDSDRRRNY